MRVSGDSVVQLKDGKGQLFAGRYAVDFKLTKKIVAPNGMLAPESEGVLMIGESGENPIFVLGGLRWSFVVSRMPAVGPLLWHLRVTHSEDSTMTLWIIHCLQSLFSVAPMGGGVDAFVKIYQCQPPTFWN